MRVIVCGGRDWTDTEFIYKELDKLARRIDIGVIIEGDARGVDRIAGYWARRKKIDNRKFRAEWLKYKGGAGGIRNQRMIDEGFPDLVVAFPGGVGTADMVRRAKAADIEVIEIEGKLVIGELER